MLTPAQRVAIPCAQPAQGCMSVTPRLCMRARVCGCRPPRPRLVPPAPAAGAAAGGQQQLAGQAAAGFAAASNHRGAGIFRPRRYAVAPAGCTAAVWAGAALPTVSMPAQDTVVCLPGMPCEQLHSVVLVSGQRPPTMLSFVVMRSTMSPQLGVPAQPPHHHPYRPSRCGMALAPQLALASKLGTWVWGKPNGK